MESSEPSEKNWTSLSNSKPLTRLCTTFPPLLWAYNLTLTVASKGSPPSMNVGYQLGAARKEEATPVPLGATSWGPLVGSRIMIPLEGRGGVLVGASLTTLCDGSSMHCFFFCQLDGGGGGVQFLAWACWGWAKGREPNRKWLVVSILLVTISASCSSLAISCSTA